MSFFSSHRLRIVEFNVENLFIFLDHYAGESLDSVSEKQWQKFSSSTISNKPLEQVKALARSIRQMDPDILMLCEVGGRESLQYFNRLFLDDAFAVHLIEGNSDRGIDIGYLVKKSLPFTYDLLSHKQRPIGFLYPHERLLQETGYDHLRSAKLESHRFSRDVQELRIFEEGRVVLILLLVHLKSQLDPNRIDPQGRDRRRAELETVMKIYNEVQVEFGGQVPIVLGGDFNGSAALPNPDSEFEAIYRDSDLQDALEIAGVLKDERFTYMQMYPNRVGSMRQLDFIFVPRSLVSRVELQETRVFRFRDEFGMPLPIPRNLNEKRLLPSDHYPVILTLKPV